MDVLNAIAPDYCEGYVKVTSIASRKSVTLCDH